MSEDMKYRQGMQLGIAWRDAKKNREKVYKFLVKLNLTNHGERSAPNTKAYISYFDKEGVSVYIARPYTSGGNMEVFVPANMNFWAFFYTTGGPDVMAYAKNAHNSAKFPHDFV